MAEETFIAVSGGFDFLHDGHVDYIHGAAGFGRVIVLLNSDEWLKRKKGYVVLPFSARKKILEALFFVHRVLPAQDGDDTVSNSIYMLRDTIKYFGNGGDRWQSNTPEQTICEKYGIQVIYGLGGYKVQSSSELVKNVQKS